MTTPTALEIFNNPKDLCFVVKEPDPGKGYGIMIARGPGHRGKMLITGGPILDKTLALDIVNQVLQEALRVGEESLPAFDSERNKHLTKEQITKILCEIERAGVSKTYVER